MGKIKPPFTAVGRYVYHDKTRRKNGEFDVVTKDDNGYVSYECKYKNAPVGLKTVHEEEWQAKELGLNFYGHGFFSRKGFKEEVDANSYRLISLDDMYM